MMLAFAIFLLVNRGLALNNIVDEHRGGFEEIDFITKSYERVMCNLTMYNAP